MMRTLLSIIGLLLALNCYAQSPVGAWEGNLADENGVELRLVVIFSEAYQVATQYRADNGAFVNTNGGETILLNDIVYGRVVDIVRRRNSI